MVYMYFRHSPFCNNSRLLDLLLYVSEKILLGTNVGISILFYIDISSSKQNVNFILFKPDIYFPVL